MDLADLVINNVIIIDKPFRRRHNHLFFFNGFGDRAVGPQEHASVFPKPQGQWSPGVRLRDDDLSRSKTRGVLFEALDAEEFAPNRLLIIPGKYPARKYERMKEKMFQDFSSS